MNEPIGKLERLGLLSEEEIAKIKTAVETEIKEACRFAEESSYPLETEAYTDVCVG